MSYEVLTLSTRTTFLDIVLYLEDSTEQVPFIPSIVPERMLESKALSREDSPLRGCSTWNSERQAYHCSAQLFAAWASPNRSVLSIAAARLPTLLKLTAARPRINPSFAAACFSNNRAYTEAYRC